MLNIRYKTASTTKSQQLEVGTSIEKFPMSIALYHYTDKESANSIDDSKIMYKSTDTIADARCGIGVYFTDMKPDDFPADEIAYNKWLQTLSSTRNYIQ